MKPPVLTRLSFLILPLIALAGAADPADWGKSQQAIKAWHEANPAKESAAKPVLRVVYFHGSDREPLAGHQERLTRIMELERSNAAYRANNTRMKRRIEELVKLRGQFVDDPQLTQSQFDAPSPANEVKQ
jgi:hypothetical protein